MNDMISETKTTSTTGLSGVQEKESGKVLYSNVLQSKNLFSRDILIGALLFFVSLTLYSLLGIKLAEGRYLDYYNLAFDFDPYLYLSTLVSDPANPIGFKHPLIIAARPISQFLLVFGMSPKVAAVITMCLFGALTNLLVWAFLRCQSVDRTLAFLLTVLFGMTSTTVITAIVPESYEISNFAVVLTWLVTLLCMRTGLQKKFALWRYVSALILVGATITNFVQFAIVEFFTQWKYLSWKKAIKAAMQTYWKFGLLFAFASLLVWYSEFIEFAKDPLTAIKHILWLRTKGEKTGFLAIFQTFFVYSFVAPEFSIVTLLHDKTGKIFTQMWDFREWHFGVYGTLAVWVWLSGLIVGIFCAFNDAKNKKFYLAMAAALLVNIIFHKDFQFRGSLYLYASHLHFLVFALFAKTASLSVGSVRRRSIYLAALSGFIVVVAANNVPLFEKFANGFVQPATTCQAPCA